MTGGGVLGAVNTRARVTLSFIIRTFKQHRAGARLGFFFILLELIGAMLAIAIIFALIGRQAAFGESIMLFMLTGFAPFLCFIRVAGGINTAIEAGTNKSRSPLLTIPGFAVSQALVTFVMTPLAVAILCAVLYFYGIGSAVPIRLDLLLLSLLCAISIGFGVGLFNVSLGYFVKPWRPVFGLLTRGLFFLSGVFYVPDFMPTAIKDVLAWNPLVHVIALFRLGFYETYPTEILSYPYVLGWSIGAMFVGLWSERLSRRAILF